MKSLVSVFWGCLIASAAFICTGCATTKMHSFVDPDFKAHSYENLMISVQVDQLDQRDDAETLFVKRMSKAQVRCVRALDVLPPTREYNDEQFMGALKEANCDGVMIVRMTQYYEDEYYVPQQSTTTTTGTLSSNTYYHGNSATTSGVMNARSHTSTFGGYTYKEPRVRHELQLWDVKSGKMAWIGGTFTKGNRYARFNHLISSLAEEARDALEQEGLVRAAER